MTRLIYGAVMFVGLMLVVSRIGFAAEGESMKIGEAQKPIEVKGQSRNITMLMTGKNDHGSVNFVKARVDYRKEIQDTRY